MKALIKDYVKKIQKFFLDRKKQILSILGTIGAVLLVSLITFLILLLTGVLMYGEDGLMFNHELFLAYQNTWYGTLFMIVLLSALTMLLCFIPGFSMALIILINQLYEGDLWMAFAISFSIVLLSSGLLYALGRFGGYALCKKFLGEEDADKALTLLRNNGTVYFPLMMMFPVFPDDALAMVAGTIKMKLSWFVPSIVIGRGVGVATIIFGMEMLLPNKETSKAYFYDWFILITVVAFTLVCIFYLANKLNKYMEYKRLGKSKKFDISNLKPEARFGVITALATLVTGIIFFNVDIFFPPAFISVYEWFELVIMSVFWSLMAYFIGRGVFLAYKQSEKHGKPLFMMRKVTLMRMVPVFVSVGVAVLGTIIGAICRFFPVMEYPYDWMIVVTAYIIWMVAVYTVVAKAIHKVKVLIEKRNLHSQG